MSSLSQVHWHQCGKNKKKGRVERTSLEIPSLIFITRPTQSPQRLLSLRTNQRAQDLHIRVLLALWWSIIRSRACIGACYSSRGVGAIQDAVIGIASVIFTAEPDEEDKPKIVHALDLGLPSPASVDERELDVDEGLYGRDETVEEAKEGLGRDMVCWKIRIQISGETEGEKVRGRVQVLESVEVEGGVKRLRTEGVERSDEVLWARSAWSARDKSSFFLLDEDLQKPFNIRVWLNAGARRTLSDSTTSAWTCRRMEGRDPVADRLSKRFMMMGITGCLPRAVEILYGWVSVIFYTTEYESSYDLSTNFGCPIFSEGSLGSYHSTLVHHSMVLQESSSADAGQNNMFFSSNKFEVNGGQLTFAQRDVSKYHSDHYYQVNVLVVQFNGSFHYVGSPEINLRIMFRVFKLGVACYVLVSIWLILRHTWEDVMVSRKPDILPNPDISGLGVAWRTCYTIFFRTSVILLFPQAIKLLL
ncbi:hypothetical protein BKA70DRAFT_1412262 [Coprinopsis sp. MPI-PUGE-AT-0042]|nr:hypothetical protein BKA70DRAFT_1412262 [Coprinopsis sp. MPI-PUGE-AT-0042]